MVSLMGNIQHGRTDQFDRQERKAHLKKFVPKCYKKCQLHISIQLTLLFFEVHPTLSFINFIILADLTSPTKITTDWTLDIGMEVWSKPLKMLSITDMRERPDCVS